MRQALVLAEADAALAFEVTAAGRAAFDGSSAEITHVPCTTPYTCEET